MATTELRGGLHVDAEALALAVRLEAAGHTLSAKDGVLLVTNGSTLTEEDRAAITRLKRHLLAIAAYEAPE